MTIYQATPQNIELAASLLKRGDLVAFPTETVYGLGANALDAQAVQRIFTAKGRPATNPLIIHIAEIQDLDSVAKLSPTLRDKINKLAIYWPGPLSLVLPKQPNIPMTVTAGKDSVAVRIPDHPVALTLLKTVKLPIAAPSANLSNYVSPTTADHVEDGLGPNLMTLDGGECSVGVESTILLLNEQETRILRPGKISAEELSFTLNEPVTVTTLSTEEIPTTGALSPGQSKIHYSPTTPLFFYGDQCTSRWIQQQLSPIRLGRILFCQENPPCPFQLTEQRVLSSSGNLHDVAKHLFSAIRELDKLGLTAILIDRCPTIGIGLAIMDRLNRAVHLHD